METNEENKCAWHRYSPPNGCWKMITNHEDTYTQVHSWQTQWQADMKSSQNGAHTSPKDPLIPPPAKSYCYAPPRKKKIGGVFLTLSSDEENKLEIAIPSHEIILQSRTLQQRKEECLFLMKYELNDQMILCVQYGNESIHDYFPIGVSWTNVKQNMDISTTPYVQIYTHLKAYEPHAKKTLKKQEQSTSIVDPLAYVAHTTSAPVLSSSSTSSPQPTATVSEYALNWPL
ncbi:hypothetical protein Tco_0784256 [Tanacetum coccineum]